MKCELINSLRERYPNLFQKKCEISCGDGWFDIIDALCFEIQYYIRDKDITFNCQQIKEKFGGLRFYGSGANKEIMNMIHTAEKFSMNICEECGAPGEMRGLNWLYVSCEQHKRD